MHYLVVRYDWLFHTRVLTCILVDEAVNKSHSSTDANESVVCS